MKSILRTAATSLAGWLCSQQALMRRLESPEVTETQGLGGELVKGELNLARPGSSHPDPTEEAITQCFPPRRRLGRRDVSTYHDFLTPAPFTPRHWFLTLLDHRTL